MTSHISKALKITRSTFLKDQKEAPPFKTNPKSSSASKLRSKISQSPFTPFQKPIQAFDLTSNPSDSFQNSKTRKSLTLRKPVTYREVIKSSHKILHLTQPVFCDECKEKQILDICHCGSSQKFLNFSMQIRSVANTDKFHLVICRKEFILTPFEQIELQIRLNSNKPKLKFSKTDLENKGSLGIRDFVTPSFPVLDKIEENTKIKEFCNVNELELSFNEGNEMKAGFEANEGKELQSILKRFEEGNELEKILKNISEANGMVEEVLAGRKALKEFQKVIGKIVTDIAEECGKGLKECFWKAWKVLEAYFEGVVSREHELKLFHKKLDLKRLGK